MVKTILIIGFFWFTQTVCAQEYFTSDFSFYQIETNPSSITAPKMENVVRSSFQFANNYSSQQITGSTMLSKSFIGLGVSLSNTNVDGNKYQKAGITVGYRNVLLSHVKIRGGIHYKVINNVSPKGIYNLYSFEEQNDAVQTTFLHNANYSVSLTDMGDRFYATVGKLNSSIFNNPQELFKQYQYISAGYLFSRWNNAFRGQVSYSLIQSESIVESHLNHNLSIALRKPITRRMTMIVSSQFGYWNNSIYRIKPGVAFYHGSTKTISLVKLSVDLGFNKFSQSLEYPPAIEATIQLKL